jgi:fatty-acyl-CoA synthase
VDGLMMEQELTVPVLVRRAEELHGGTEIVSRLPDRSLARTTYAELVPRSRRLGAALLGLGLSPGDRIATLCWNHASHLEAYLGIPAAGLVCHTLNLRLAADELAYIASHGGDRALVVDESLLPLARSFLPRTRIEHVVVVGAPDGGAIAYEELVGSADDPGGWPALDERSAAAMCFTSGTTGRPKGVVYSHRALLLHTLVSCMASVLDVRETDTVLPVVPMFHANAWGLPLACTLVGAKQVLPGPHLDPASLLELLEGERVTFTAGVPTIWLGLLQLLDAEAGRHDLSALRRLLVGGAAAPRSMIDAFEERHGLDVLHAWGMTEMTPIGTVCTVPADLPGEDRSSYRAKQGRPVPLVDVRARAESGAETPWDGATMGELEVRGSWIAAGYHEAPEGADRWTDDGWFRTGDIVTIDERGTVAIQDRTKDVIKSGGEWISSVALENALMGYPAVAEAAVIAIPDERWLERPLAAVVLKPGAAASAEELRAHLAPDFAPWQLPDRFEFVDEIPKTAVGKFRKTALRERFAGVPAPG